MKIYKSCKKKFFLQNQNFKKIINKNESSTFYNHFWKMSTIRDSLMVYLCILVYYLEKGEEKKGIGKNNSVTLVNIEQRENFVKETPLNYKYKL